MDVLAIVPSTRRSTRDRPAATSSTVRRTSSMRACSETAKSTMSCLRPPSKTRCAARARRSRTSVQIHAISPIAARAAAAIAIHPAVEALTRPILSPKLNLSPAARLCRAAHQPSTEEQPRKHAFGARAAGAPARFFRADQLKLKIRGSAQAENHGVLVGVVLDPCLVLYGRHVDLEGHA